ncbi:hypothetical protein Pedsa_3673 [Pseudopedobacter saltans DSM 12145]|uniref:Uncharacterized protein n=1 Tax=Pseudopedobacter saltans (strain ATCC 51119 / DSM 12145 / JCM 21818 / CCUG 39354 / LMG 10337 / NBRC 100064 / NCIMB 13643) TaxID=762903 RepID=F0S5M8_PSESL|nr:hypothetical protein Pedsa_3673 [Pseudopedobacter saltans DSM 12145]
MNRGLAHFSELVDKQFKVEDRPINKFFAYILSLFI